MTTTTEITLDWEPNGHHLTARVNGYRVDLVAGFWWVDKTGNYRGGVYQPGAGPSGITRPFTFDTKTEAREFLERELAKRLNLSTNV